MQSFFKSKVIVVDGVTLTLKELSAADHLAMSGREGLEIAKFLCKCAVKEWEQESEESIGANVPARVMKEIAREVFELSGLDAPKNSEPTPVDGSSSA